VATINKEDPVKTQLMRATPRFIIAIFIGLVISTPLEMKIFSKEINNKLREIIFKSIGQGSKAQLDARREMLNAKERELNTLDNEKNSYYRIFRDEINGGTTGQRGYGKKAREFEGNYNKSVEQYNGKKVEVDSARADLKALQFELGTVESITDAQIAQRAGVEMRVIALYSLNSFHWVITALFILFEILPMIVKLLGATGNYEKFSRDQRELYQTAVIDDFKLRQNRAEELREVTWAEQDKQRNTKETIERKLKEEILLQLAQAQKDIVSERIVHFKKKSLEALFEVQTECSPHSPNLDKATDKPNSSNRQENEGSGRKEEAISVNPQSSLIVDPLLEEIIWKGEFDNIPSTFVFHSEGAANARQLVIKKGVNTLENSSWCYKGGTAGKLQVSIRGNKTNFSYQISGAQLLLKSKRKELIFNRLDV